jgi:O-antigen/teichoic acid export membrane protein
LGSGPHFHSQGKCGPDPKFQALTPILKLSLAFAVIAAGLAGRSAVDKLLALRGGAEAVARWAQLSSAIDLVSNVALAGIGGGLTVLVAQAGTPERQYPLLGQALRPALAASLVAAISVWAVAQFTGGAGGAQYALAALCGWIAVVPGLVHSFWLGQEHRGRILALAVASALVSLAAATLAPQERLLEWLAFSMAAPALVLLWLRRPLRAAAADPVQGAALRRYLLPGVVIGVLSPASMLAARALVADALSWHEAGVLQALWRMADWICGPAGGALSLLYLARMSAAYPSGEMRGVLRAARRHVLLPSALLLALLGLAHAPLLPLLYEPGFEVSPLAAWLFFAGSAARIGAWIPLYALYAMRRTGMIAAGEVLSLPLFVLLLALAGEQLTLELAGAFWLASYLAYWAFNAWAARIGVRAA